MSYERLSNAEQVSEMDATSEQTLGTAALRLAAGKGGAGCLVPAPRLGATVLALTKKITIFHAPAERLDTESPPLCCWLPALDLRPRPCAALQALDPRPAGQSVGLEQHGIHGHKLGTKRPLHSHGAVRQHAQPPWVLSLPHPIKRLSEKQLDPQVRPGSHPLLGACTALLTQHHRPYPTPPHTPALGATLVT